MKVRTGATFSDLTLSDKRKQLWQWDTGCKINLTGLPKVDELHYCREGTEPLYILKVYEDVEQRLCKIPDELLQIAGDFVVYAYCIESDGSQTSFTKSFTVKERPKPNDYVYTETEILTYTALEKRVRQLEEQGVTDEQLSEAIESYLNENPVGGVSEKELNTAVENALEQAKESGEFNGKDGIDGKDGVDGKNGVDGKDGYTPQKGVDYFDGKDGVDGKDGENGKDGQDGADGKTPEKGVDYFTEADKQELVTDVLNSLPTWNGGAY